MRLLGLDIGDKNIGIALSDPEEILASPLTTLVRNNDDEVINSIADLVRHYGIRCLIVGIPYNLNSRNSLQTDKTTALINRLEDKIHGIQIIKQDERFTTAIASRLLREARGKKRRSHISLDAASAAVILQEYLNRVKPPANPILEES